MMSGEFSAELVALFAQRGLHLFLVSLYKFTSGEF